MSHRTSAWRSDDVLSPVTVAVESPPVHLRIANARPAGLARVRSTGAGPRVLALTVVSFVAMIALVALLVLLMQHRWDAFTKADVPLLPVGAPSTVSMGPLDRGDGSAAPLFTLEGSRGAINSDGEPQSAPPAPGIDSTAGQVAATSPPLLPAASMLTLPSRPMVAETSPPQPAAGVEGGREEPAHDPVGERIIIESPTIAGSPPGEASGQSQPIAPPIVRQRRIAILPFQGLPSRLLQTYILPGPTRLKTDPVIRALRGNLQDQFERLRRRPELVVVGADAVDRALASHPDQPFAIDPGHTVLAAEVGSRAGAELVIVGFVEELSVHEHSRGVLIRCRGFLNVVDVRSQSTIVRQMPFDHEERVVATQFPGSVDHTLGARVGQATGERIASLPMWENLPMPGPE